MDEHKFRRLGRRQLLTLGGVWMASAVTGMGVLMKYSFTAGAAATPPQVWPRSVALPRLPDLPTLVMVAHPRCSCTRASMGELSWIMTRLRNRAQAFVLFIRPDGLDEAWEQTDLWKSASIIEGVTVFDDLGGKIAEQFGAKTSGQTYLFDAGGKLLFSGGITPTRSHHGDNVGRRRILSLVDEGSADRNTSDVFGCPLAEEDDDLDLPTKQPRAADGGAKP